MSEACCEEFRELASAFADERLEGADLLRLQGHLEACDGCRRFEAGQRRFRQLLRAAAAVQPLRRPPQGFAAGVVARLAREGAAVAVPLARSSSARRPARLLMGLAAAAAAALFFAWSWQRLLPVEQPAQRVAAERLAVSPQRVAAAEEGSMDAWLRQHALLARDGTILGPAEEIEFASFRLASPGR